MHLTIAHIGGVLFSGCSSIQHREREMLAYFGKFGLSGASLRAFYKIDKYEVCIWPELHARCRSWPSVRYDTRKHIEAGLASILRIRNLFFICSPLELKIDFHQGFEWWCLPDLWHRWVRWGTLHPRGTPHHPEHICKLNIWHFTILGTFIRDFGIHHHYHPWFPCQICKHKYGYFKVNLAPNVFRLSYCWRDIDKIQMQSWLL